MNDVNGLELWLLAGLRGLLPGACETMAEGPSGRSHNHRKGTGALGDTTGNRGGAPWVSLPPHPHPRSSVRVSYWTDLEAGGK